MADPIVKSPDCRGFFMLALAMLWPLASSVHAAASDAVVSPMVSCEADYGGRSETLQLQPTADVYATQSVTLGKRFRFHAQYLPERAKLKTWVYELRERGPLLLHAAEYPLPPASCLAAGTGRTDFGLNKVYSSDFERELFFHCATLCR